MDTDRNLLFGVLALQADLLTPGRFVEACTLWANQKQTPLADLLVERGWLSDADRADIQKLLGRKLKKHGGDARASLAEVTTDHVRQSLAGVEDPDVRQTLAGPTPPPQGHVLVATTAHLPEARARYTLSRLHATGGIGRVWLAHDDRLGRDVALKELRPERAGNPVVWGRFLKEAQITGQLEHPGIVPIYELGHRPDDQAPFYTMRFVRGRTLAEAVAAFHQNRSRGEAGPLELRELLTSFVGVCNAVAYAHSRGVLHRDLKPQNVVLGDYGEVMVLDWGLAKLMDQTEVADEPTPLAVAAEGDGEATMQGEVLGTPAYMAPEQAEGRLDRLSPATDVYGLGAILYEVLTGQAPFTGAESTAVLRRVIEQTPSRPRALVPAVSAALEAVCLKALAKKRAERYASAKELAGEVQRFLAGEPVTAYREPLTVRAGRWVKRHRVLVSSAAAAGLVALVGLVLLLVLQARANRDLQAANERERQRFELALEAIKTFHTGVSEDVLLKQEQFQELQKRLLGGAAEFYGKLEQLLQDQADVRSRRALGTAYYELGDLTRKISSQPEALKVYRKALAVRRELAGEPDADVEVRLDVARSLLAMVRLQTETGDAKGALASAEEARALVETLRGATPTDPVHAELAASHRCIAWVLSQTGKLKEALAAYEQARALEQKLADASPTVSRFQSDLANSHNNIGWTLAQTGQLKEALAAYEQSLALRQKLADANPSITSFQSDLAFSHNNVGNLLAKTGQLKEALAAYEQSLALRQKLADANPSVTAFQSDLARSHNDIGMLLAETGKPKEALTAHQKARAIYQKLADANPSVTAFQRDLANSHMNIANLLTKTGQPKEALAAYEQSLALAQKLAEANPTVTALQRNWANSHLNIGALLLDLGQPQAALTAYQKARAIYQKLADANPSVSDYQYGLAGIHNNIGLLQSQTGNAGEALASYQQTLAIFQKLVNANPKVPAFRRAVGMSLNNIGEEQTKAGQLLEAIATCERARDLHQALVTAYPTVTDYMNGLAFSLSSLGRAQQRAGRDAAAVASLRRAIALRGELPTLSLEARYDLACDQALLATLAKGKACGLTVADGQAAAEISLETLRQAVAAGYANLARLRIDTDLDVLRSRPEFQKLLKDVEAKAKTPGS
jgi:serine/threonine-protein kinase